MYRLIASLTILIFIGVNTLLFYERDELLNYFPITIQSESGTYKIKAELAVTPQEKSLGLMNREELSNNSIRLSWSHLIPIDFDWDLFKTALLKFLR